MHRKVGHESDFTTDRGQREQLVRDDYLLLTRGTEPIHQLLENKSPAITLPSVHALVLL